MSQHGELPVFDAAALSEPITVLTVGESASLDDLRTALDDDRFRTRTASSRQAALDRLDGVDCVVSDHSLPDRTGHDLLASVRERRPTLPFLLVVNEPGTGVAETLPDDDWTDVAGPDDRDSAAGVLRTRVQRLVRHHRTGRLAGQALTAVETAWDGIALVGPDETFQLVNQAYASRLGYDPADLYGRDWRDCYPPDEVDRLERTALQSVSEGWLWTGSCQCLSAVGETVTARTRITGVSDGSMVILHCENDGAA